MPVPGNVQVEETEIYDSYINENNPQNPLSKKTVSQLICKIFSNIKVVHHHGKVKYRGLRQNFYTPEECSPQTLDSIAEKHGFVKMNKNGSKTSYICFTDYTVNNHNQIKSVEVFNDKMFQVKIGEILVSSNDIGLDSLKILTTEDANIVFNTVKMSQVCCGKLVSNKCTPKRNMLQLWVKRGDENSSEYRLTSNKCKGIVSFSAYSSTCAICRNQTLNEINKIEIQGDSTEDRTSLLRSLFPHCSEVMFKLLSAQCNICNERGQDPRCRRWDKEIVQICLTLWNRSPQAYVSLVDSGVLVLPSISLLQKYKNCFEQTPGLNDHMLQWMFNEAKRLKVDMRGGLILDEMGIQDDLKMSFHGGKNTVDGLVDMGSLAEDIHSLNTHENELRLATHVMQFLFLSYDGFRFPFAYFPTTGANAPEIYIIVWEAISKLSTYDFTVDYVCFDGASNNRAFQMMHFEDKEDAKGKNFTTKNPYSENSVTFIMDYSHNIKKLRNNINSSGDHEICTRKLTIDNFFITWDHWIKAFNWDRSTNPLIRVHQKLTNEHIFLTKTSKMRNHLAEEVLNKDMLNLMKQYKESLSESSHLDKSIELLEHTSAVIEFFRDRRPVSDLADPRLDCLKKFQSWLEDWCLSVDNISDISAAAKAKRFLNRETYSDLISMITGFTAICTLRINSHKKSLVPAGLNSDIIENFFCQQRTICHGSNTNPTLYQYKYGINATILGQNAISKKSNAFKKRQSIEPFIISKPGPLKKKCIRI